MLVVKLLPAFFMPDCMKFLHRNSGRFSMDKEETAKEAGDVPAKAPVLDGEYSPERMMRLVSNLREELADNKKLLAEVKKVADRVPELETKLEAAEKTAADKEAALHQNELDTKKRSLLTEAGLSGEYARFLSGEDEEAWAEDIRLLTSTHKQDDTADTTDGLLLGGLDLAQTHETRHQGKSEAESRAALARQIFGD